MVSVGVESEAGGREQTPGGGEAHTPMAEGGAPRTGHSEDTRGRQRLTISTPSGGRESWSTSVLLVTRGSFNASARLG